MMVVKRMAAALGVAGVVGAALVGLPGAVDAQPDGTMLTIGWDTQELHVVDPTDASSTLVGETDVPSSTGLAWDPTTGTLFAMSYDLAVDELYTVDPDTGDTTLVGSLELDDPTGLEVQPGTGTLFITYDAEGGSILATVDKATAAVTDVGPTMDGEDVVRIGAIAFHPTTGVLYGMGYNSNLYTVDPATGALTLLHADVEAEGGASGLTFDCAGTLYTAQSDLFSIDLATGDTTLVGELGLSSEDNDFVENLTVVCGQPPEPTTSTTSTSTPSTPTTTPTTAPTGGAQPVVAAPRYTG